MSMLNCFFSRQYAERGDLFEGLSIWEEEKYRELQGTYPVIFISFADVKQNNYEDAVQKIKNIIVDVYRQHRYLEQQECFSESEKQNILSVTEEMNDVTAQDALKNLSKYLKLLYGKKVLIFLDSPPKADQHRAGNLADRDLILAAEDLKTYFQTFLAGILTVAAGSHPAELAGIFKLT